MTKQILLFVITILCVSCSKDEDPMVLPLTIERIDGFVSTGSTTFQVTNLLENSITSDIQLTSPFFVLFSRPVAEEWLKNETTPKLLKKENGDVVAGINLTLSIPSSKELTLEPVETLEPGTTYSLVINPGYEALDGGIMEEHVIADFITVN